MATRTASQVSTPSPSPSPSVAAAESNDITTPIVVAVAAATVGIIILIVIFYCIVRRRSPEEKAAKPQAPLIPPLTAPAPLPRGSFGGATAARVTLDNDPFASTAPARPKPTTASASARSLGPSAAVSPAIDRVRSAAGLTPRSSGAAGPPPAGASGASPPLLRPRSMASTGGAAAAPSAADVGVPLLRIKSAGSMRSPVGLLTPDAGPSLAPLSSRYSAQALGRRRLQAATASSPRREMPLIDDVPASVHHRLSDGLAAATPLGSPIRLAPAVFRYPPPQDPAALGSAHPSAGAAAPAAAAAADPTAAFSPRGGFATESRRPKHQSL